MIKKSLAGLLLAVAALAMAAPSASATEEMVSRGTYPSQAAAEAACQGGIRDGAWELCRYRMTNPQTGTVELLTNR
ncbi:hypothetical protein [Amycolatopsis japonica]